MPWVFAVQEACIVSGREIVDGKAAIPKYLQINETLVELKDGLSVDASGLVANAAENTKEVVILDSSQEETYIGGC